jgi:hypothetical protein
VSEVEAVIHDSSNPPTQAYLKDDDTGTLIKSKSIEGTSVRFTGVDLTAGNIYRLVANSNGNSYTRTSNGDSLPQKGDVFDFVSGIFNDSGTDSGTTYVFKSLVSTKNSLSIPKAEIVDEPFTMRNRVYSQSAGSNGQSDFTIATTGDGGSFGMPILTVVSVKKNGSVLDSANWSFDDTDTVTIDTSNVTIASGDTIDIKYDFDVFDSTLKLRSYLNRESTTETSPSISHFRYEYLIQDNNVTRKSKQRQR